MERALCQTSDLPSTSGRGQAQCPALRRERAWSPPRQSRCAIRARGRHRKHGAIAEAAVAEPALLCGADLNQRVREGSTEAHLVAMQASKEDDRQPSIASCLPPFDPATSVPDVCVVGCGPAGLALAAELGAQGLSVALIGRDAPFVNNYGVWRDEFVALGLEHTLDATWRDALCYFGEGRPIRVGRAYGRVCRRGLRAHLLGRCGASGVAFHAGEVASINAPPAAAVATLTLTDGTTLRTRMVTLAAGAAAGKFLRFEGGAPGVASQSAYGVEAEVEGYGAAYDSNAMLFMDFRRHHSGVWDAGALRLRPGEHPAAGEGLWGTGGEVPSFLYAMPISENRVFLEETCLVARPALPFATLQRRLHRRLRAMGLRALRPGSARGPQITRVLEEEWSYIPVGGPLPLAHQTVTAFGAAANLVHPATGYSVARSLREAPGLARSMADVLGREKAVGPAAAAVWDVLWPAEKRRQAAFHVFGMELLAALDLQATNAFFATFFRLPDRLWRGFLASSLSSTELVGFALVTYAAAPPGIKWALMRHLVGHPAGAYLLRAYLGYSGSGAGPAQQEHRAGTGAAVTERGEDATSIPLAS